LADAVTSRVEFEIRHIDRLFASYCDLLSRSQRGLHDLVEITALASVLQSFYNRLESIFLSVPKAIDADVPTGPHWHRELLTQMTRQTTKRSQAISPQTAERLAAYLAFRHFYRHSYSFFLDWGELEDLALGLKSTWGLVRDQVESFLAALDRASCHTIRTAGASASPPTQPPYWHADRGAVRLSQNDAPPRSEMDTVGHQSKQPERNRRKLETKNDVPGWLTLQGPLCRPLSLLCQVGTYGFSAIIAPRRWC
jgi:hypothetical protein